MPGLYHVGIALVSIALGVAQTPTLQIRFVGNAGFELSDGATTLLVDLPYRSGAFDYMTYDPGALSPTGRVVSVVTHRHADHFDPDLFGRTAWEIVGPTEVTRALPSERVLGGRIVLAGEFRIQRFRTPHGDTEHYSYLIEWRGHRMYFVGDTESPSHVRGTEGLDLLFVTPWLSCALEAAGGAPAARTVLHHHAPAHDSPVCGEPEVLEQGEILTIER